jgi:hypothetical protein
LRRWSLAPSLSLTAGVLQVLWIVAHRAVIGRFHWLRPTMLGIGLAIAWCGASRGVRRARPR